LNSRLVIEDPKNAAKHVLHCGFSELYLADRLRDLDHSFENATDLPNVQTNPVRTTHYPQGRDDFTNNLSVIRPNGEPYQMYLSKLKVSVPLLIKFVLENGDSNVARDGNSIFLTMWMETVLEIQKRPSRFNAVKLSLVVAARAIRMNASMDTVPPIPPTALEYSTR
jgi:hypothetical protein